ncbi:amidohydrolase family protein [Steroidobacter sp.]|uniref:amidohydrolase family protein n=1 Tax=Steroidobacter sp. TaxID=1978227 RepID=UPI001A578616|nr:amidohydrolase family protein [Steroidobacter sp.]MBL8267932.1 amidohydrolase family protein [Steroidobacter sp.]
MKGSRRSGVAARLATALLMSVLASQARAADLVIDQVTVVSPQLNAPQPKQNVLIRDGRIVAVSAKPVSAAADAVRIDGRGKFLTPGLMDSHVHVGDVPGLPYGAADPVSNSLREAYTRQQPRSYLYYGVTQLLDLASLPEGIAAFEAQPQRPDLFRCGPAVVLDGYPSVFVDPSVRYRLLPDYIYEPANAATHPLPKGADAAQHTPEVIIDRIAASGARCVKIFIEDGFGGASDWPLMSKETLQRVRAATRKHGLLLLAHANAIDMQRIAVETQVDVLAHGLWNWNEYSTPQGVPPAIAAHLRDVHAKKIGYQPTLRVIAGLADLFREDTLKDPAYAKVVPAPLLQWYATPAGQWFKELSRQEMGGVPDMKAMHNYMVASSYGMRATKYLHDLGHPLLLGSDTPSAPTFGSQPGYDTYREMRMMAQSGIALPAIFRAATLNNVRQFGLDKDYGTVEAGKVANLLLLTANPLETMRAWTSIDRIILRGTVIKRESLAAPRE